MDERPFAVCGLEKYREKYPPVLPAKENAFTITREAAQEPGLPEDVLVTSGPMDVSACALGSGVTEAGQCCSIMGTAALHEMVLDKPLQDDIRAGMTITHVMEKQVGLRLMASLAGTPNLEWMLNTIGSQVKADAKAAGKNVYAYMEEVIEEAHDRLERSDVPSVSAGRRREGAFYRPAGASQLYGDQRAAHTGGHRARDV